MVSREDRILLVAIPTAILLGIIVLPALGAPEWLQWAALLVIGVILPGYLTSRNPSDDRSGTDG
jgi:hypothetical protein